MVQKELFQAEVTGQGSDENVLFGSSSFSEPDWVGPFYPKGTPPGDFLGWYASRFRTVEVDATYYAVPALRTVEGWYSKTPSGFSFAAKFPRTVVHGGKGSKPDASLILDSDEARSTTDAFLTNMSRLQEKLGSLLIQFPYFNRTAFKEAGPFLERLDHFLADLPTKEIRFAVEIRNKAWLTEEYAALVRGHGCAVALVDHAWMPHGDEVAKRIDPLVNGFGYVRLVGDRYKIEEITESWDKEVLDQSESMTRWAKLLSELEGKAEKIVVYVNNHFAGHAPATLEKLMAMYYEMIRPGEKRTQR